MEEQEFDVQLATAAVREGLEQIEVYTDDVQVNDATVVYHFDDGWGLHIMVSPTEILIESIDDGADGADGDYGEGNGEEIVRCTPKEFVEELDFIVAKLLEQIDGVDRGIAEYEAELTAVGDVESHTGGELLADGEPEDKSEWADDGWEGWS